MKLAWIISSQFFVIFVYFFHGANAHLWSQPSIPENKTNVLEEWKAMDKDLKSMTSTLIKAVMPMMMESADQINLTAQCTRDIFMLIAGMKGLKKWAFQFVDSSAKLMDGTLSGTMSYLGVYQECVDTVVPHSKDSERILFRGQYCLADIRPPLPHKRRIYRLDDRIENLQNFTGSEILTFLTTKAHLFYFQPFKAGLCIPSGCTRDDLSQILKTAGKQAHLNIDVTHCEIKEAKKLSEVHLAAIGVCCILGSLVLLGTFLEVYFGKQQTNSKQIGIRFLLCFSAINNFKRLSSTQSSEDNVHLKSFHGFRFLSITWIVVGHSYLYPGWFIRSYRNLFEAQSIGSEIMIQMVFNGSEAVDSFFFMSGCLLSYLTIKYVKIEKKKFNLKQFIFHRLWRIIPTYYFVILFAMLVPLMGSGPLFYETMLESVYPCYQYWWRNLLFINNFFHMSQHCMMHTWYIACDMQLYLASLLVLLPLIRWERIGVTINLAIIAISVIYTGVISALKDVPSSVLMIYVDPDDRTLGSIYSYANALSRAGPYFIGILVGYILATRPTIKMPKKIQVIGWCLAILSSGSVIFATAFWAKAHTPSQQEMYAYSALFKVAFTAGIGWMMFCCCTGHGGFINQFLSWKAWVPFSKLTFLVYLIQPILQSSYIANFHSTQEYTHLHFIMQFFGFLCISTLLAMVCNLLVESPFMAMEKLMSRPVDKEEPTKDEEAMGGMNNYALEDIKAETNGKTHMNGKIETNEKTDLNGKTDMKWATETNMNGNTLDSKL